MDKTLYKPFKYTGKGVFKYSVYVKADKGGRKIIHFGHRDYKTILFKKGKRYKE